MKLGDKIAKMRKENNYTQDQLADRMGVSRQSISKWESGAAYPETDKIVRLSNFFGCSLDYLLKDDMTEDYKPGERVGKDSTGSGAAGGSNITSANIQIDGDSIKRGIKQLLRTRESKKQLMGMPLWAIGGRAKGFFALGLDANGVFALGLKATGVVSVGLLGIGVCSFGVLSIGLLAAGVIAIGLLSAGSIAMGILSAGAVSIGVVSVGAASIGDFAFGAFAQGKYFAYGDEASGLIAIGKTAAKGSLMEFIGTPDSDTLSKAKDLLRENVPGYLSFARAIAEKIMSNISI